MDDVVRQNIFECPCDRLIDRRGAGVDGDLIIPSTRSNSGGPTTPTCSYHLLHTDTDIDIDHPGYS
jgi:hypothetical protein